MGFPFPSEELHRASNKSTSEGARRVPKMGINMGLAKTVLFSQEGSVIAKKSCEGWFQGGSEAALTNFSDPVDLAPKRSTYSWRQE